MTRALALALGLVLAAGSASAQQVPPAPAPAAPAEGGEDEMDRDPDAAEPDVTLVNLPTALRLPRHGWSFRVTHRFTRPLGAGDFGDLASDLFGLDGGAQVGLELRFAPTAGLHAGVYRTSDRTIELFVARDLVGRREDWRLAVRAGVEGRDNFSEDFAPALAVVLSRRLGTRAALYAVPWVVGGTRLEEGDGEEATFLLGLGARVRLGESRALVAEFTPRLAGHRPGEHPLSFAVEKRMGGHVFQVNAGNVLGSTPGQLARGGFDDWFLGFNISRKFY